MFDPRRICEVLNEAGVDYVVVGGLAAALAGSALPTEDIDILPSRTDENLERLAVALTTLNARIRTGLEPVPVKIDAPFLLNMPLMLNLTTDVGDLDLTFSPSGPLSGFDAWAQGATEVSLGQSISIRIAALDDVIDSKRAANRPKDLMALPYLEALRDERNRTS
jgi:hypothetical protein